MHVPGRGASRATTRAASPTFTAAVIAAGGLLLAGGAAALASSAAPAVQDPGTSTTSASPGPTASSSASAAPALVLFQGPSTVANPVGPSNRAKSLIENKEVVQGLRGTFGGIMLDVPLSWQAMQPGHVGDAEAEISSYIDPLLESGAIEGFDHNYLAAYVDSSITWSDDAEWTRIAKNFTGLGKISRAAGARGLMFDTESYTDADGDGVQDKPLFDWDQADGDLATAQRLARTRGKQVMAATLQGDPDAQVVHLLGAATCVKWENSYELMCPFIAGLIDAATAPGQVVDGGEEYWIRGADEFTQSYSYRDKDILSEPQLSFLSAEDKKRWTQMSSQSFGVMNKWSQFADYTMDPTTFEETTYQALTSADEIAWTFIAEDDMLRPGFPADWRKAMDNAVSRATSGPSKP
jgi:hypothetical protein